MTYMEYRQYMKNFFKQYYHKLSQDEINIMLPLREEAKEMWSDDADPEKEWKKWKMIPATVKEEEINELEKKIEKQIADSLPDDHNRNWEELNACFMEIAAKYCRVSGR